MDIQKELPSLGVLSLLFIVFGFVVYYPIPIFDLPPISQHQWRQSDAYSMYYMYYRYDFGLFEPRLLNQFMCQGRQVSELPLHYYILARISHLMGEYHESLLRILAACFTYWSSVMLYLIARALGIKYWLSVAIGLSIFGFPIIVYYGFTSLPEVPVLAYSLTGLYGVLRYYHAPKAKFIMLTFVSFMLASTMRIYSTIPLLAISFAVVYKYRLSRPSWVFLAMVSILTAIAVSWLNYTKSVNALNFTSYYLTSPMPFWTSYEVSMSEVLARFVREWLSAIYYRPLYLVIVIGVYVIYRVLPSFVTKITFSITAMGYSAFFLLMFYFYYHHDYGLIPYTLLIFASLLAVGSVVSRQPFKIWHVVLIFIFIFGGLWHSRNFIQYDRYGAQFVWDDNFDSYIGLDRYLDSLDISRDAQFISIGDGSSGISLYLAKRRGFTSLSHPLGSSGEAIRWQVAQGTRYLMLKSADTEVLTAVAGIKWSPVGCYRDIQIWACDSLKRTP